MNALTDDNILSLIGTPQTMEKGFRLLMQTYQEQVYWQIRRIVIDHDDANDVVQNTFIKVYKSIGSFEGKSKLFTWLYRIATNEALTFVNNKKRHTTTSIEDTEGNSVANTLEADSYFDGDDTQLKLKKAVALLPEKQQLVFNMRYYDELPYSEISEILGTSEGALKASYHHAVKKIEGFFMGVNAE